MTKRVLVVDDHPAVVRTLCVMLERHGFKVDTATDGDDALRHLRASGADLVLLDIMMPHKDGLTTLCELRADPGLAGIPVILVTAKAEDPDILRGYRSCADYYLTKPFTGEQLFYAIELVLG